MQSILSLGCGVIGTFALIFLFYTNSFLIRRRKKEFGLYNILGMGKWNLARILLWETLMIAGIALGIGLFLGILLSKLAELGMVRILSGAPTFSFSISLGTITQTLILFAVIFVLILLNTLRQIHLSNPIELLHSENTGEKPPKANWLLALIGVIMLGGAYYLAVSIDDPVLALVWFFVAVLMVIVATYLLFVAGSVAFCRVLQKNKRYYYKTNHFVSVSSMVYRMKRNGAGLASICILCTMVLVMLSSTVCLYIGTEESLRARYPRHINLDTMVSDLSLLDGEQAEQVREICQQVTSENGQTPENILDYRIASLAAYMQGDHIEIDTALEYYTSFSGIWQLFIVPLEDYNRLMGENETLNPGEALIYTTKMQTYPHDTITVGEAAPLTIRKAVSDFEDNGVDTMQIFPSMYLFVPNFEEYMEPLIHWDTEEGEQAAQLHWLYGFDLDCEDDKQIQIQNQIAGQTTFGGLAEDRFFSTQCEGVAKERSGFYGMNGGLFFLGILLGVVFIFAAVLIMYYKQVSEGYEDQSRFAIMQKVGMTKKEIRKSINSQILTVFFLPLLMAGVHLAFAFPLIYKLLLLMGLFNQTLLILVTAGCYLLFALFYVLVYRITSRSYYSIVSGARGEAT